MDGEQFMTSFSKLGSLLMCRNSLIRVAQAIKMRHFSARKYFISQPLLFYHYTRSCFAYPLNSFNVFKILFIVGRCVRGCACKCKIEFILLFLRKGTRKVLFACCTVRIVEHKFWFMSRDCLARGPGRELVLEKLTAR